MKLAFSVVACVAALVLATGAFGANPNTNGQPSQSCLSQTAPTEPGQAALAPGSAFNEPTATSPGGTAGMVYAGNGISATTPANVAAVSQYDVACFQVSLHH
jgi:hypothetical protein